jgi:hypothetical protein
MRRRIFEIERGRLVEAFLNRIMRMLAGPLGMGVNVECHQFGKIHRSAPAVFRNCAFTSLPAPLQDSASIRNKYPGSSYRARRLSKNSINLSGEIS